MAGRPQRISVDVVRMGLAAGLTPQQIADRADCAIETVRRKIAKIRTADPTALATLRAEAVELPALPACPRAPTDDELHELARSALYSMLVSNDPRIMAVGAKMVFEHIAKSAPAVAARNDDDLRSRVLRMTRTADPVDTTAIEKGLADDRARA